MSRKKIKGNLEDENTYIYMYKKSDRNTRLEAISEVN